MQPRSTSSTKRSCTSPGSIPSCRSRSHAANGRRSTAPTARISSGCSNGCTGDFDGTQLDDGAIYDYAATHARLNIALRSLLPSGRRCRTALESQVHAEAAPTARRHRRRAPARARRTNDRPVRRASRAAVAAAARPGRARRPEPGQRAARPARPHLRASSISATAGTWLRSLTSRSGSPR